MPTAKVKCRDCRLLKNYRCELRMEYMMPDKPRYCKHFIDKRLETLPFGELPKPT